MVPRNTVAAQRLKTIEVDWGTRAPASVLMPALYPALRTGKGKYIYNKGAAAGTAAGKMGLDKRRILSIFVVPSELPLSYGQAQNANA